MNILGIFLNNELRTGGHLRYLELMEGLANKGHSVLVFLNGDLKWRPVNFSASLITLPYIKGKTLFLGRKFRAAIKRTYAATKFSSKFDWIVVFGETHWAAARFLSKATGTSILFAFRSDSVEENTLYLKYEKLPFIRRAYLHVHLAIDLFRQRSIIRHARNIVFQSEADRSRFVSRQPGARRKRLLSSKSAVVRGDIRQKRFLSEYTLKNDSSSCRRILFVGTLGTRKGLAYLLEAIARAVSFGCSELRLDILAAGNNFEPYQNIINSRGLESHVFFHGKVSNPLFWMVQADLLVVPSIFDSYPNAVLEAIHVGLPVIASKTGGLPDMLDDADLLFSPADSDGIAQRIIELYVSTDRYLQVRTHCRSRRVYFDFDWPSAWECVMNRNINGA